MARKQIQIDELNETLRELIGSLDPFDEIELCNQQQQLIATITRRADRTTSKPCQPGSAKHLEHWMAPDFDEPLDDFAEYMP